MPVRKGGFAETEAVIVAKPEEQSGAGDFPGDEFWEREIPRFVLFARHQMLRQQWRGAASDDPLDYVARAVVLILDHTRNRPPDVDPVPFVLGVIRSLVTHDAEKTEHRQVHTSLTSTGADDVDEISEEQIADHSAPAIDELLSAGELARDFVNSLPEEYRSYVELLISGVCATAAECAERLGVSVADIRLMDKAIRRRRRLWKGAPPP